MDMVGDDSEKRGTVVGTNVRHLRVRDAVGMLYLVRHSDAELVENVNAKFESVFLREK
jgi:hypothetical protein